MTTNFVQVQYERNANSVNTDKMGMREMQARAFDSRASQYLLLKSPPASGKSRALMFIALDKMINQSLQKTIIAVPEKSIGGSFSNTKLTSYGFFADWNIKEENNLCIESNNTKKSFVQFMNSDDKILICTHSTLRNALKEIDLSQFNNCLLAIDEFHHVSSNDKNILGKNLQDLMDLTTCHIVAMTGSYFRGDSEAILLPEYESRFDTVTYNYYEQLNGYKYLKTLGIGYHFYQGSYIDQILDVLDTKKKTILHIPNVMSRESSGKKYREVDLIIEKIGILIDINPESNIYFVQEHNSDRIIKIANLVDDTENSKKRSKTQAYLRNIKSEDDVDLIIALNTAKEGFDWKYCEHSLTIGYRGSLVEIIQIIGRCTRDSENKTHAQFTNLIANPDVSDALVKDSVNNMLKAITCSLLMEQILEPRLNFRSDKSSTPKDQNFNDDYKNEKDKINDLKKKKGSVTIIGFMEPSTDKVRKIIKDDMTELQAAVLQDNAMQKAMADCSDQEVANEIHLTRIIQEKFKGLGLSDQEIEEIRHHFMAETLIKPSRIKEKTNPDGSKSRFIEMANKHFDLDNLSIDLISSCNIYKTAFDVLSKHIDAPILKAIKNEIASQRITMTKEEALVLFREHKIEDFMERNGRAPSIDSLDPMERRLAEAVLFAEQIRNKQRLSVHNG